MNLSHLSGLKAYALTLIIPLIILGCHSVDDERIPYSEVHLVFTTVADWNIHGVKGDAADYGRYIYNPATGTRLPADFPYNTMSRTGYGGILLVNDALGSPVAYDLSCPYEARPATRIEVPEGELFAVCPECGSTFDIYTNHGNPRSGPAAREGYALQRYSVISGGALEYRVVTR